MKKKKLLLPLRLLLIAVLIAAVALTFASCGNGTGTGTQKATDAATEAASGTGTGEASTETGTDETEAEAPLEAEKVEVGSGAKTITVNVIDKLDKESKVWFEIKIKTDAENLADAMTENKLAEGSESEYGLYITKLLVPADSGNYEKEADADHFWSLEQNGEMLMTGASSTPISDGEAFDFVYTALN